MQWHTGQSLKNATPNFTGKQREQLGQELLRQFAEVLLKTAEKPMTDLLQCLELDGYRFQNSRLLLPEADILDTKEATGVLESLFKTLALENAVTAFHHLSLSEEHYLSGRWDDSISNSRKFFECTLQEVAMAYSLQINGQALDSKTYTRPVEVRIFLEEVKLLEEHEVKAIREIYALLSHTGGHPYMAQSDQARLLRNLALTVSQFVMLRLEGRLKIR